MINSKEYWEQRFSTGDWDAYGGQDQTRFFYELAVNNLPQWLISDIKENSLSIVDVGCAEGAGADLLKRNFSRSRVVGIDFSQAAINQAKDRYVQCEFECVNAESMKEQFDVVLSSNVLEHLKNPFEQLDRLVELSDKYCIVLLPFQEEKLHKEHFNRFDYDSFMLKVGDSYLAYHKEVDTSKLEHTMWPGKQIILVYVKEKYLAQEKVKLSRMNNGDFEKQCELIDELNQVKQEALQKEQGIGQKVAQKEQEVKQKEQEVKQKEQEVKQKEQELISCNYMIEQNKVELLRVNEALAHKENELIVKNQMLESKEIQIQKLMSAEQIYVKELEALRNSINEKEVSIQDIFTKQQELETKLRNLQNSVYEAKNIGLNLANTKMFKFVHLIYRLKHQLVKGSIQEKKAFFKWLRDRKRHSIQDHSLNPIFQVINQLELLNMQSAMSENIIKVPQSEHILKRENTTEEVVNLDTEFKMIQMLTKKYDKVDILFLSVIDYNFRYQRPQHLANAFSKQGYRVFYINANFNQQQTQVVQSVDNIEVISLNSKDFSAIYSADYTKNAKQIEVELEDVVIKNGIRDCLIIVEYPTWVQGVTYLKNKYGFKVITDYLDDYTGFEDTNTTCLAPCCYELLENSDRVIASSNYLAEVAEKYNPNVEIVRNGTEYECFHKAYDLNHKAKERKVVGYYGAIAHWFDFDKVVYLAQQMPEVDFVLIGEVSENKELLSKCPNIKLLGEKTYNTLPDYLKEFDVCLIPFDTSTDLIKATNPVKFYEYLSAAKKVVATEIPELMTFQDKYVYLSNDNEQFLEYVKLCLEGKDTLATAEECLQFAKENDWKVRGENFIQYAIEVYPKISVVVLTYNQLDYTKECLQSIIDKTAYPNYEIIIVDNKSQDETPYYLLELEKQYSHIKVILNDENLGFAQGNNVGIKESTGEYIVLLNNDTVVTRGWLTGMVKHFYADKELGIVGPVTNSIGNESKINVSYEDISDMEHFAYQYTTQNMNTTYNQINVLAMFCIMFSREAFNKIGYLESLYGVGMFEDDDYSYKAKSLGYKIKCAEDVFVHHYGSVSFKKLEDKKYLELFNRNKKIFEERWNVTWKPHKYRPGVK